MESTEPRRSELWLAALGDQVRAVAATGEEVIITEAGTEIAVIISMADYERLHAHADVADAARLKALRMQSQIDDNRRHPERRRPRPPRIGKDNHENDPH